MTPTTHRLDIDQWLRLFKEQRYAELAELFLRDLAKVASFAPAGLSREVSEGIERILSVFLDLFVRDEFNFTGHQARRFVSFNPLISNLAAVTSIGTTDRFLAPLCAKPSSLAKILTLYSARNSVVIDPKVLFDSNPALASHWYVRFMDLYLCALPNSRVTDRLRAHMAFSDDRLVYAEGIEEAYYGATYVDENLDREFKRALNASVRRTFKRVPALEPRDMKERPRIAVVSGAWRTGHAVYKNQHPFLTVLQESYDLDLFDLYAGADPSLFKKVFDLSAVSDASLRPLIEGGYSMVYFPDVGMSGTSIVLSNMRFAPVQVCSLGHSVSTFGSEIDYFITGASTEDAEKVAANYDETPVLIPGLGIVSLPPTYQRRLVSKQSGPIVVACPWSSQKCNHELLVTLQKVCAAITRPVRFVFLVGHNLPRHCGHLPFVADVVRLLGVERVKVVLGQNYEPYMECIEAADFVIDSFPFGGCNSVIDALYLHKPIVTFRGARWYGRIGASIAESAGLGELVVSTREEYEHLVIRLIEDESYRQQLARKLKAANFMKSAVFDAGAAQGFQRAIDRILELGTPKGTASRAPVVL